MNSPVKLFAPIAALIGGVLMISACIRSSPNLSLDGSGKALSYDEISGYSDASQPPIRRRGIAGLKNSEPRTSPAQNTAASGTEMGSTIALCQRYATQLAPAYAKLATLLDPKVQAAANPPLQIPQWTEASCATSQGQALFSQFQALVSQHSGRIGVILPLSGPRSKFAAFVVQGMRAALSDLGHKFDEVVVLGDSSGGVESAGRQLAQMVLINRVSMILGGLEHAEAEALAKWSEALNIPSLLLNRDRQLVQQRSFVFRVYPDEYRLASTLAAAAKKRGLTRIAILRPNGASSEQVVQYFKAAHTANGGQISFDISYTPGSFDSMQAATKQLFRTEAADRREEYTALYNEARKKAKDEGVPFDPRMVLLKPLVDFDALFIPDNFRSVRHLAKLIKFQQVEKLTLIGNHEWRSPALIEPWDEILDGSIFADFIGSYAKLPQSLGADVRGNPLFVSPSNVVPTDFKLIGYRAAISCRPALAAGAPPRQELPSLLLAQLGTVQQSFEPGPLFDDKHHSLWPTYVFGVRKGAIELADLPTQDHTSPAANRGPNP